MAKLCQSIIDRSDSFTELHRIYSYKFIIFALGFTILDNMSNKDELSCSLTFNYLNKLLPNQSCCEGVGEPLRVLDPQANSSDKIRCRPVLVPANMLFFVVEMFISIQKELTI